MNSALLVDTRWDGVSGIGRFSREVTSRLRPGWRSLGGGAPSSARDVVNRHRLLARSTDVIYSPGYNGGVTRARQLLTLHDLMHLRSERSLLKARYYENVVRPIIVRCGAVLTVSDTSRSIIEDWLGDDRVRVINVGNGLSIAPRNDPPSAAWRSARTALYVGNMKPHKNFTTVANTVAGMEGWSLDVVTTDPDVARETIHTIPSLSGRVRILSRISDVELAEVYAAANVVVMPSTEEGFGLPAIEAVAADRHVVYWSGCDAIGEVLGPFGIAVSDLNDTERWRQALSSALEMPRPSEQAGFSEWLRLYEWDDVANRVQAALDNLTSQDRRRETF